MLMCLFSKNGLHKFLKKQKYDEYKNKRKNMYDIGNYKPYSVYYTDSKDNLVKLDGLCSLCDGTIHISIGQNPNRLILSIVKLEDGIIKKDVSFHIYKFTYEKINDICEITQYHIYTAMQEYLINNNNIIVAV